MPLIGHALSRVTVEVRAHTVDVVLVCDVGMSSTISMHYIVLWC